MWRKKFLRFLKEEGVYGEWVYNIRKQHPTTDFFFWKVKLKEIFSEEEKCADCINYSFIWRRTKQGYNFWLKLSNKWTKLIRIKCNE